jgi:hypothetical protein
MEQLKRDKQREYQALYAPQMFEGVPIQAPVKDTPIRTVLCSILPTLVARIRREYSVIPNPQGEESMP